MRRCRAGFAPGNLDYNNAAAPMIVTALPRGGGQLPSSGRRGPPVTPRAEHRRADRIGANPALELRPAL